MAHVGAWVGEPEDGAGIIKLSSAMAKHHLLFHIPASQPELDCISQPVSKSPPSPPEGPDWSLTTDQGD